MTIPKRQRGTGATLAAIALVLALMSYAVVTHPTSLNQEGLRYFLISVGALLAYAGLTLWIHQKAHKPILLVLGLGTKFGLMLAGWAIINLLLEHFTALTGSWSAIRGVSMWGLMFLLFGTVGSVSYQQSGSLVLALLTSVWSAIISTLATLVVGYGLALLFMPHMQQVLDGAYAQSGMRNAQAFVIYNSLSASFSHLLITPFIAAVFGFVGGYAYWLLNPVGRKLIVFISIVDILLLIGGVACLHFASSLNRADRAPFILLGLLTLGLTLACMSPLLSALQHRLTKV